MWGADAADSAACRAAVRGLRNEGIFTPPSLEGTLARPSNIGGAHWGGVAYDPEREIVVVPVNTLAGIVQLIPQDSVVPKALREESSRLGYQLNRMKGTPYFMRRRLLFGPSRTPCTPPPFGKLVAVSLRTGQRLWDVPLGSPGALTPLGRGSRRRAAPASARRTWAGRSPPAADWCSSPPRSTAICEPSTSRPGASSGGRPCPPGGKRRPMTFRGKDGRQYVVIAAGGDGDVFGKGDEVLAFALPR